MRDMAHAAGRDFVERALVGGAEESEATREAGRSYAFLGGVASTCQRLLPTVLLGAQTLSAPK